MNKLWTPELLRLKDALSGKVRLVGGCVRDYIVGIQPQDFDLATPLTPTECVAALTSAGFKSVLISPKHGVIKASVPSGNAYEIATLREDLATDGNHAIVRYTTDYQQDAKRRDFTINALSMDVDGTIYDYFGGLSDLKQHIVRFIGQPEKRITEDFIRIYRYIRFWSLFGEKLPDAQVVSLCQRHREGLRATSIERRQKEILKIVMSPRSMIALRLMDRIDVLRYSLPIYDINRLEAFLKEHFQASALERVVALTEGEGLDSWHLSRRDRKKMKELSVKKNTFSDEQQSRVAF